MKNVKKVLGGLAVFGLALASASPAFALPTGFNCLPGAAFNAAVGLICTTVTFTTPGGIEIESPSVIPTVVDPIGGKIIQVAPNRPPEQGGGFQVVGPGFEFVVSADMNPDPSISYNILATNTGSVPTNFLFQFLVPIVPVGSANTVQGSVLGILTDSGNNGVTLTPLSPPPGIPTDSDPTPELAVYTASADPGGGTPTTFTTLGVDVGPAAGMVGTGFYGQDTSGPLSGPTPGPWNWLRADIAFTLSANDTVQLSGSGSLNSVPTPEPGSLLLLSSGLIGLGAAGLRKRRSHRR